MAFNFERYSFFAIRFIQPASNQDQPKFDNEWHRTDGSFLSRVNLNYGSSIG